MAEVREERTPYAGLLALMNTDGRVQGFGFPYWNWYHVEAMLNALYQGARTGAVPLTAPNTAPTVAVAAGGTLPAGMIYEVGQTFVDAYGRETVPGTLSEADTGTGLTNPATGLTAASPASSAGGFDGGSLLIWFTWFDATGGETLQSPVLAVDIPYRAGGLKSTVDVTLPSTPTAAGAAGANIYTQWSGGNVVLAYSITDPAEDEATLDNTPNDCGRVLPVSNTTGSEHAIEITGDTVNVGEAASYTRFYIRPKGSAWTAADRRLKLSGVDQWDPATVTYPLTFTGASTELAPGYPPTVSQVKAIKLVDLATEVTGKLPSTNMADDVTAGLLSGAQKTDLTDGNETTLHSHAGLDSRTLLIIAVAPTVDVDAADGKAFVPIPPALNGMNLVSANAIVNTAGTTNATTVDVYNVTDSHEMLSSAISIASGDTVGTAGTVNGTYDDVATNDVLRIDVPSASTTNAKGLMVMLEFQLP